MLFNIASLLANPISNTRFQFDKYKVDRWDIEHIRSVASEMPTDKAKQKTWLENVLDYISDGSAHYEGNQPNSTRDREQTIKRDIIQLLQSTPMDESAFEALYQDVIKLYDPDNDSEADHSIGNLTLLDSATNRSYQNAVFPIKRSTIIALDKKATFVPLCTKNVFLKYYSKKVDKMLYWESKDTQDHLQAMVESIDGLFRGTGVHS
ncbi:GmrSD restriction endonuclease domain-containing protein [Marinomonas gallaica]|uniref:GmrSD restriction endonuclease domain-containing protein n=1 Tax=Marinomonas gallaica TaxID=1806667 RepID=UPI003CE559BD